MIDSGLVNLLTSRRNEPLVADCLALISHADEVRYRGVGLAPLSEIIDIYSVRARINARKGGPVEGYSYLLPALEAANVPSVRLHSLESLSHWFIVFTDESSSLLFGLLKSPKMRAAWYDPAKGFKE